MIHFDAVTKEYGTTKALDSVSLKIQPGEFVIIKGASGAGKTTLAKLLIREIKPTAGSIQVGDFVLERMKKREVPVLRRQIGMVFQDFKLLPDRTAGENIAMALEIAKKPKAVIKATVTELMKVIGLEGMEHHFPHELSGGEAQRIVIARALATEPAVIFADEPTGNLDDETGFQIMELLKRINQEGTAVIMATHNTSIIQSENWRVITLEKGRITSDTGPKQVPQKTEKAEAVSKKATMKASPAPDELSTLEKVADTDTAADDLVRNMDEEQT